MQASFFAVRGYSKFRKYCTEEKEEAHAYINFLQNISNVDNVAVLEKIASKNDETS